MSTFRLQAPRLRERDVAAQLTGFLRLKGYRVSRQQSGRFKTLDGQRIIHIGESGIPDYYCLHPLYPGFYLETKAPAGAPSPAQIAKRRELVVMGIPVCTTADLDTLTNFLGEHEARATARWRKRLEECSALK